MLVARIESWAVASYPYELRRGEQSAKRLHPDVWPLPADWMQATPEQMAALQAVEVLPTEQPEGAREGKPAFVDGAWRQVWIDPPAYDPQTQTVRWDGSQWVVESIPLPEIQSRIGGAIQSWIDGVCTSGVPYFRDIFSARGYVNDPNPDYHARAVALRDWSSSVWTTLDTIQADVLAGNRPFPTEAELFAELPQPPV
jgi:hypothetical protein